MDSPYTQVVQAAKRFLFARRTAYQQTFRGPTAEVVLKDLAKFCRAHESTYDPANPGSDRLDGRREVWLRIAHHLHLPPEQLWQLYDGRPE